MKLITCLIESEFIEWFDHIDLSLYSLLVPQAQLEQKSSEPFASIVSVHMSSLTVFYQAILTVQLLAMPLIVLPFIQLV